MLMKRTSSWLRAGLLSLVLGLGAGLLAACGQSEGERCEVDSDCKSGLQCLGRPSSPNKVCRPEDFIPPNEDAGTDVAPAADAEERRDVAPADTAPPTPDVAPDRLPDTAVSDVRQDGG
jgi:hypothetical protein